ncbi:hypothetical protein [Daejeonella oryzae]|uniref:hypothetical protein n=1 Tax=Daejeonella oryzae TaxID=1122943 RepID=UPI000415703D|nr:hypothetical protein [Daejeonella oryzae]
MAEIHIQRKRKNLWWLWLLIILIVLAVVYYLYTNNYFGQQELNVFNLLSPGFSSTELTTQFS